MGELQCPVGMREREGSGMAGEKGPSKALLVLFLGGKSTSVDGKTTQNAHFTALIVPTGAECPGGRWGAR